MINKILNELCLNILIWPCIHQDWPPVTSPGLVPFLTILACSNWSVPTTVAKVAINIVNGVGIHRIGQVIPSTSVEALKKLVCPQIINIKLAVFNCPTDGDPCVTVTTEVIEFITFLIIPVTILNVVRAVIF